MAWLTVDWSQHVPVMDVEIDALEAWLGDLFGELFGDDQGVHCHGCDGSGGSLPPGLDGTANRQRPLHPGSAPPGERLLRIKRLGDRR
jgi:hypothetical protein